MARALLGGGSAPEVAMELGIGTETARTHFKNILRKTGTRRQVELVSLLLGMNAPIRQPGT
ncbi:helix-turn-helix transcriptional regulator [Neorhizobium sp. NPDC001467]|uniref:helix-turn-helix transcriptional regulator n=1 Tax=Neorhizobium sp. NPDC001467 TaxID=3390595 RepID=UPI003CFE76D4